MELADLFGVTPCLVGLVIILLAWVTVVKPRGIPPGPLLRVPFRGHLIFVKGNLLEHFRDMRKVYGDIFHFYMGNNLAIVLNGYDVIKEAAITNGDMFADRPHVGDFPELGLGLGINFASGPVWKEQRRFALRTLRDFGFGRNILQEKISVEVQCFLSALEAKQGQAVDLRVLLFTSVSNVISSLVLGKHFEFNDPVFERYMECVTTFLTYGGLGNTAKMNLLRKLPGDVTGYKRALNAITDLRKNLIEPEIRQHMDNYQPDKTDNFLDSYINKSKEDTGASNPLLSVNTVWKTLLDMFLAGTETTGTTIRWAVLYLLHYPSIQDRLFQEIQENLGSNRPPRLEDQPQLPLLTAFIMEVQRMSNVVPLAIPHAVKQDFILRGHRIPKSAMVFFNLDSVLKDPEIFKDPETFLPDRFLQGACVSKPEQLIPFSLGRRMCLGESLAKMELFLFLSAMIQRFLFERADSQDPPGLAGSLGTVYFPPRFEVRAVPRK